MRHEVDVFDQLRGQMGWTGAVRLGICVVAVVMFVFFAQRSAAQPSTSTIQDTNPKSLIKPIDRSLASTGKTDGQTAKRTPHRLIRKSQSAPVATLQPIPLDASKPASSSAAVSTSPLNDTTTQSKDTAASSKTGVVAAPATTPLSLMSTAATTTITTATPNTIAPRSSSTGTTSFAGATTPTASTNTSNGASTPAAGRSMSSLAAGMPGLTQLVNPPSSSPPAPVPPAIGASPTSLSFTAQQGGSNPAAQTLSISNIGGGTLSWSASDNAAWLSLSPASGTGNGTVAVSAATGTLTAGSYSASVTLSATGATPITVPVSFTVTAAPVPPAIGASPTSLSFTAQQGSGNPAAQTVSISNTGGGTLSWSASDNGAWLPLSPNSGSGGGTLTDPSVRLAPHYPPVSFTVTAVPVPPAIGPTPTSLSFTAQQGGTTQRPRP